MIRLLKESVDNKWREYLKKASTGISTSDIYNQPNVGLTVDINPDSKSIGKAITNIKSMGFKLVDRYIDNSVKYKNDSYYVFRNNPESSEDRIIIGIVFQKGGPDDFAFINIRYNEDEGDNEYFD